MTTSREKLVRTCEEIGAEHADLMALVARIEDGGPPAEAAALLDELHAALAVHFSHETSPDGFYQLIGARSPEYEDDLRLLSNEHDRILATLWTIKEQAATGEPDVADAFAALVDMLHGHERKEYELTERLLASAAGEAG